MGRWLIFIGLFYLGAIFLSGLLRKQWVEAERLSFPMARVPLDVTAEADGPGLVPAMFKSRAFLVGMGVSIVFGAMRLSPLLVGKEEGWLPEIEPVELPPRAWRTRPDPADPTSCQGDKKIDCERDRCEIPPTA